MKFKLLAVFGSCLLLTACSRVGEALSDDQQASRGRYSGIGIYSPDKLWSKIQGAPESKDAAIAKLADDDAIIVVSDSQTGEVRQCGNHSGFCTVMNPWKRDAKSLVSLPAKLSIHREQLEAQFKVTVSAESAK